ncbi:MAG: hypothetical protein Q9N34_06455 [Aquificota bacterium]|nr:hypothetical protein [Aquificota bacterium]
MFQIINEVTSKLEGGLSPDESGHLQGVNLSTTKSPLSGRKREAFLLRSRLRNRFRKNRMDVLNKQKSDNEDADLSERIMEYTRYRTAYDALMRIIADTRDMTILRYL